MKIRGNPAFLIGIAILTVIDFGLAGAVLLFNPDGLQKYWPEIVGLLGIWAISAVAFARDYFKTYTLDENGITEHSFGRQRTLLWQECRFIKRIRLRGYTSGSAIMQVIICSRTAPPVGMTDDALARFQWPKEDTFQIKNAFDSVYEPFLTYCGGEKDLRT